jgi:hypothetical protein
LLSFSRRSLEESKFIGAWVQSGDTVTVYNHLVYEGCIFDTKEIQDTMRFLFRELDLRLLTDFNMFYVKQYEYNEKGKVSCEVVSNHRCPFSGRIIHYDDSGKAIQVETYKKGRKVNAQSTRGGYWRYFDHYM